MKDVVRSGANRTKSGNHLGAASENRVAQRITGRSHWVDFACWGFCCARGDRERDIGALSRPGKDPAERRVQVHVHV